MRWNLPCRFYSSQRHFLSNRTTFLVCFASFYLRNYNIETKKCFLCPSSFVFFPNQTNTFLLVRFHYIRWILQILWNMAPTPAGDCFYECLRAETRGIFTVPDIIKTKSLFDDWCRQELNGAPPFHVESIAKIERLFSKTFKLIVTCIPSQQQMHTSRRSKGAVIALRLQGGVFYSERFKRPSKSSLPGIASLEFWLRNVAVHLSSNKTENSCTIFVVGTHLDEAGGSWATRREQVEHLVSRYQITVPVHIHEVALYPIDGCADLMPGVTDLYRDILLCTRRLPHMGELVPRAYITTLDTIRAFSAERQASNQRSFPLSLLFY